MKELGYGKDYKYAHDYKEEYVYQEYLPDKLEDSRFYFPSEKGYEKTIKERLERWRKIKDSKRTESNKETS
jgi:putative ATPase